MRSCPALLPGSRRSLILLWYPGQSLSDGTACGWMGSRRRQETAIAARQASATSKNGGNAWFIANDSIERFRRTLTGRGFHE